MKMVKNIKRYPTKPRCNPSEPRGLPPTGPRQSEPECAKSDPSVYKYDIRQVICLSRYFFRAQRTGITVATDVPWRGLGGLKHGCDAGVDLTGGWYDGGDNVVFVFPMAHATTMLAWSIIEFKEAYEHSREYRRYLTELKWGTDFLIKGINTRSQPNLIVIAKAWSFKKSSFHG